MYASVLGDVARVSVLTLISIQFATYIIKGDEWKDFYSNLSLRLFLVGGVTLGAVILTYILLDEYVPGMGISWLNLFDSEGENVIGFSDEVKYFGILVILLLMLALPKLAIIEEELFREGTGSWPEGIIRSLIFGMVHMIVGVPFGIGLALTIAGLVFTHQYFQGGVRLSALTHFHYNLIAVSFLLIGAITFSFSS